MRTPTKFMLAMLFGALAIGGCAGPVERPEESGFLSDYSRMDVTGDDGRVGYIGDRVGEFDSFIIEPVEVLFERDPENAVFTDEEIEDLRQHVVDELTKELTEDDGYAVVTAPGPGVARIRLGLAEVDDTIGLLNVSTYTKITGLGLGGVSFEAEMLDSVTDEQLAAMIRWGSGSRVTRAGFTHTGDAKILIDRWARDIRERLDEIHGR